MSQNLPDQYDTMLIRYEGPTFGMPIKVQGSSVINWYQSKRNESTYFWKSQQATIIDSGGGSSDSMKSDTTMGDEGQTAALESVSKEQELISHQ